MESYSNPWNFILILSHVFYGVGWIVSPKKTHLCPNLWNLLMWSYLEDQVKKRSYWVRMVSTSNDCHLYKRKEREIWTHSKKEDHVKSKSETGVIQVRECQGLPTSIRSQERGTGWILPQSLHKEPILLTTQFQTCSLKNCDRINFYCLKAPNL